MAGIRNPQRKRKSGLWLQAALRPTSAESALPSEAAGRPPSEMGESRTPKQSELRRLSLSQSKAFRILRAQLEIRKESASYVSGGRSFVARPGGGARSRQCH